MKAEPLTSRGKMGQAESADIAAWLGEVRGNTASVPCNGCRHCCTRQAVLLFPEYGDEPANYQTERVETPAGPAFLIERHDDGACVYLGAEGCTIYERRPAVCRAFDCGKYFARHTRAERRVAIRKGDDYDRELFAQGRRVQQERSLAQVQPARQDEDQHHHQDDAQQA